LGTLRNILFFSYAVLFPAGFGVTPLITASFSEEFGRQPLYIVSIIGFMLMQIGVALSNNIQTVIVLRFLQGAFGSTGSTMVGGTIADIWMPHERGLPMAIIGLAAIAGSGIGPFVAGWIVMNHRLDWRWIQWVSASLSGVCLLAIVLFMHETRSTVLLAKLAKKIRKETGDERYRARIEDDGVDLKRLIYVSCTRPIFLLTTEPIVASFSVWVGFAWGIVFVLLESIAPVFRDLHQFNSGQIGSVFVSMMFVAIPLCLSFSGASV
jgi:multidrug resistance protein